MKKQIKRKISLLSKGHLKPIEVVQYETGVQLVFEVQDIELDTSATATLFVRKPSGKFVFQEDNISLTGNTVVIDLHNQAITEYGHPFFQIKFKKDEEVISTFSGMLTVEKSLDDSGAEESKTVLAAFDEFTDEQIARIEEATRSQIDLMKAEIEAKGETVLATIPDEYTEMYNRVNILFNSVANAIKGTVSGSVVRVDDVSPVEHKPVVKVVCPEGVDPETVTVRRCGKNLVDLKGFEFNDSNYTHIRYVGDSSSDDLYNFLKKNTGKSIVLSMTTTGEKAGIDIGSIRYYGPDNTLICALVPGVAHTIIELPEEYVCSYIYGGTNGASVKNIQVEFGTIPTTFEEYNGTEHTPSSDGTVEGITSLSPVMTLLTDTEGVTIECEYNKDTGKVIEKLTNAVVALGGVV